MLLLRPKTWSFIKHCERQIPKGKRIGYLRADAASYQAEIFSYCEQKGIKYAIGAETVHCMEKTKKGENISTKYFAQSL